MKAKLFAFWMTLLGLVAAVAAWFKFKSDQDAQDAGESKQRAEALKAKVAEVKAEQAARKEATDAAVAKVDEAARVDSARDPVDLANGLLADYGKK